MNQWKKNFRNILVLISLSLIIIFIVFVFNQFAELYRNVAGFSENFAAVLIAVIAFIIAGTITLSLVSFFRYPKVLELPENPKDEEYKKYVVDVYDRLQRNRILKQEGFKWSGEISTEEIMRAYDVLEEYSDSVIAQNGNAVFLTTAISQNGVLDGVVILATLMKMMWTITRIYEGRPSIARMIFLYTRVAGVIFIARSIEDFDIIEEQIEPLVASIIGGSVLSLIPGSVQITNLVVNSLMEGSVNALLTLRVGIVTRKYLTAMTNPARKFLRRTSSLQAAGMLGGIIRTNSVTIIKSFAGAVKNATVTKATKYNPFK